MGIEEGYISGQGWLLSVKVSVGSTLYDTYCTVLLGSIITGDCDISLHSWVEEGETEDNISWERRYCTTAAHLEGPRDNSSRAPSTIMIIQGDHSGCSLGLVDIKTKVVFHNVLLILKCNFCTYVNGTLGTT